MTNMKAKKGDLIRIIPNEENDYIGKYYEVDNVFEVDNRFDQEGVEITADGKALYVYDEEYVIHRKAGEEDSAEEPVTVIADAIAKYNERQDAVNPQHYKQGRVEVIDIIEDAVEGADPFEAVCQANVLKYALRYRHKNGVEDLRKSIWYTEKLIAYLDAKSTQDKSE